MRLEWNGEQWTYSIERLGDAIVMDELSGGTPVVIFSSREGPHGTGFLATAADCQQLTFVFNSISFQDVETGSTWNMAGLATTDPLEGAQLPPMPTRKPYGSRSSQHSPNLLSGNPISDHETPVCVSP